MTKKSGPIQWLMCTILVVTVGLSAHAASATDYVKPKGKVILTITGNISPEIEKGTAEFDRETLSLLPQQKLKTRSFYSAKRNNFEGVLMRDLLDHVQAKGTMLEIIALDDYMISVPLTDYYNFEVLLATRQDGKYLTVRDRGPSRMIYPVENHKELTDNKYASRYIWQIKSMHVK